MSDPAPVTSQTVPMTGGNITCSGCGRPAAISTRMGTGITCQCGLTHTPSAVVVETTGECSDPSWHDKQVEAIRASRKVG